MTNETNVINSGTLSTLQPGECLLVKALKTSTDKIQLEFAEKIAKENGSVSALTILNASDNRFSSGATRGWAVAEVIDASQIFDINFGDDADWYMGTKSNGKACEMLDLNILNPKAHGLNFRVVIKETTEPTKNQQTYADDNGLDVAETQAKRAGKGGDFILHEGQYIFRNSYVELFVEGENPVNTFLAADKTTNIRSNAGVRSNEVEIASMI